MPDHEKTVAKKIFVVMWMLATMVVGVVKIVLGSLGIDSGCVGMYLLPYYLLLGGVMALTPVVVAVLSSCCSCRSQLEQLWGFMATLFMAFAAVLISGTVYILCTTARATSIDRLCTHPWLVIAGLVILVVDWILFAVFLKLFCVVHLPPESQDRPPSQIHVNSPFHLWKLRLNRQRL
ncbi:hypothetical protein BsWGS_13225 [Bradybaena similaris]